MEGARPATAADADACAELCRRAADELQHQRGGPLYSQREAGLVAATLLRPGGLDALVAAPDRQVLVGTVDDAVVGLAVGTVDDAGETALGIVDALYVEPEARGVGVGRALLDDLVVWFSRSACRGIDVTALPGDRRTKNFFEGAGFKARLLTMHHPLP